MAAVSTQPYAFTSVGKKFIMGVTGLIWAGFVMGHMAGNLLMFISSEAYNAYGHAITSGYSIYLIESVLLAAFAIHVFCAVALTIENRKARGPQKYAMSPNGSKGVSIASKTMAIQGSLILVFLILHIATFKYGTYYETTVHGVAMRDLYRLMHEVFQQPGYVVWYVVCLILLGFHLSHGFGSTFQSLGIKNERTEPLLNKLSILYGLVVAGGFISQPLFMLFFAGK